MGLRGAWQQALGRLATVPLAPAIQLTLAEAAASPSEVLGLTAWLEELVRRPGALSAPEAVATWAGDLLAAARASAYPLSEWVAALARLHQWTSERGQSAPAAAALGYVSCCAEWGGLAARPQPLCTLLDEMLATHGFAAALPGGA